MRRLRNEDPGELVIDDLTLRSDREVRRDEPLCAGQAPVTSGHFPYDRAPLKSIDRARAEGAAPHGPERNGAGIPVSDAAGLDEQSLANDFDLGLEARRLGTRRFNRGLNPVGLQDATERLTGR